MRQGLIVFREPRFVSYYRLCYILLLCLLLGCVVFVMYYSYYTFNKTQQCRCASRLHTVTIEIECVVLRLAPVLCCALLGY